MAHNYVRPALRVFQQLDDTVTVPGDHLGTCIVGPQYELYRYGHEDIPSHHYSSYSLIPLDMSSKEPGIEYSLDMDTVSALVEDAHVPLYTGSSLTGSVTTEDGPFVISFDAPIAPGEDEISAPTLISDLKYPVQVGDIMSVSSREFVVEELVKSKYSNNHTAYYGVRVNQPIPDSPSYTSYSATDVKFFASRDVELEGVTVSYSNDGIKDIAYVKLPDTSYVTLPAFAGYSAYSAPLEQELGKVYVSYRKQVVPHEDEDVITVEDIADVQDKLGKIDPDNDLAYGCYCALQGAEGRPVKAIRTRGVDSEAFVKACEKTEADSTVANFCPITEDPAVMRAVFTFNQSQSTPERKHWRVNYFGGDTPTKAYDVKTFGSSDSITVWLIGNKSHVVANDKTKCDFNELPYNGALVKVYPGDVVRITSGNKTHIGVVNKVISSTDLELTTNIGLQAAGVGMTISKPVTPKNTAEHIGSLASMFSDRRAVLVWADQARNEDGVIDSKYLAAEVAGKASAFQPQAPMTRAEMASVTSAPRMYTKYTQNDLDAIATQGVMIVTQDTKGSTPYIRHQLTTEMDKGILYQELSITRNLDNISYDIVDALETHIGRSNVTNAAISALTDKVLTILTNFTSNSIDPKIGPSIGKFENLRIYQDPTFLTRVIIKVKLYLPVPMNNIDVYELAYAYDSVSGYVQTEAVTESIEV